MDMKLDLFELLREFPEATLTVHAGDLGHFARELLAEARQDFERERAAIAEGKTFEDALRTRTFEPDGPNFTPRISAIVKGDFYEMSILKSAEGDERTARRYFFDYPNELPGYGHLIHTYESDGNPLPSFEGEPTLWEMVKEPFDDWSDHVWEALNPDNKVSLFTRVIDLETGETRTHIYNRNQKEEN